MWGVCVDQNTLAQTCAAVTRAGPVGHVTQAGFSAHEISVHCRDGARRGAMGTPTHLSLDSSGSGFVPGRTACWEFLLLYQLCLGEPLAFTFGCGVLARVPAPFVRGPEPHGHFPLPATIGLG